MLQMNMAQKTSEIKILFQIRVNFGSILKFSHKYQTNSNETYSQQTTILDLQRDVIDALYLPKQQNCVAIFENECSFFKFFFFFSKSHLSQKARIFART